MLSENGLQQTHARCWACSRHPSAAAQHSFDVRTALHGSVLSASRQASRRKKKILELTFNTNTNEQTTHDPSWASCAVPPGHSATPQDPILPISHHGRQRSVVGVRPVDPWHLRPTRPTSGPNGWRRAAPDAVCRQPLAPWFRQAVRPRQGWQCGKTRI